MGKVPIVYETDNLKRTQKLSDRKKGLLKSAHDLQIICGVKLFIKIIPEGDSGHIVTYGSDDLHNEYRCNGLRPESYSTETRVQYDTASKSVVKIDKHVAHNKKISVEINPEIQKITPQKMSNQRFSFINYKEASNTPSTCVLPSSNIENNIQSTVQFIVESSETVQPPFSQHFSLDLATLAAHEDTTITGSDDVLIQLDDQIAFPTVDATPLGLCATTRPACTYPSVVDAMSSVTMTEVTPTYTVGMSSTTVEETTPTPATYMSTLTALLETQRSVEDVAGITMTLAEGCGSPGSVTDDIMTSIDPCRSTGVAIVTDDIMTSIDCCGLTDAVTDKTMVSLNNCGSTNAVTDKTMVSLNNCGSTDAVTDKTMVSLNNCGSTDAVTDKTMVSLNKCGLTDAVTDKTMVSLNNCGSTDAVTDKTMVSLNNCGLTDAVTDKTMVSLNKCGLTDAVTDKTMVSLNNCGSTDAVTDKTMVSLNNCGLTDAVTDKTMVSLNNCGSTDAVTDKTMVSLNNCGSTDAVTGDAMASAAVCTVTSSDAECSRPSQRRTWRPTKRKLFNIQEEVSKLKKSLKKTKTVTDNVTDTKQTEQIKGAATSKVVKRNRKKKNCICGVVYLAKNNKKSHPLGRWMGCECCDTWVHAGCVGWTDADIDRKNKKWICSSCGSQE